MHLDIAATIARIESHTLIMGVSLQMLACLMNSSKFHKVQIGVGLLGVFLMVVGFHRGSE